MTTVNTIEALAAIRALSIRYRAAMADGKVGWLELAGFIREAKPVRRAIENIHLIPEEAFDLTDDEVPEVSVAISETLSAWGVSHRDQDVSGDVVKALSQMLPHIKAIKEIALGTASVIHDRPPTALPE